MAVAKVISVGDSVGIVLPKEIMEKIRVAPGDTLYIVETPTSIKLTHRNPEFEANIEIARRIMKENDEVLRKLAK